MVNSTYYSPPKPAPLSTAITSTASLPIRSAASSHCRNNNNCYDAVYSSSLSSEALTLRAKFEVLFQEFVKKAATILLERRIVWKKLPDLSLTKRQKPNKSFNIITEEWEEINNCFNSWDHNFCIEIFAERYSSSSSSSSDDTNNNCGGEDDSQILIERWLVACKRDRLLDDNTANNVALSTYYKKSIALIRSLYSFVLNLPAYDLFRKLNTNANSQWRLNFTIYSVHPSIFELSPISPALASFAFTPLESPFGTIYLSVLYKEDWTIVINASAVGNPILVRQKRTTSATSHTQQQQPLHTDSPPFATTPNSPLESPFHYDHPEGTNSSILPPFQYDRDTNRLALVIPSSPQKQLGASRTSSVNLSQSAVNDINNNSSSSIIINGANGNTDAATTAVVSNNSATVPLLQQICIPPNFRPSPVDGNDNNSNNNDTIHHDQQEPPELVITAEQFSLDNLMDEDTDYVQQQQQREAEAVTTTTEHATTAPRIVGLTQPSAIDENNNNATTMPKINRITVQSSTPPSVTKTTATATRVITTTTSQVGVSTPTTTTILSPSAAGSNRDSNSNYSRGAAYDDCDDEDEIGFFVKQIKRAPKQLNLANKQDEEEEEEEAGGERRSGGGDTQCSKPLVFYLNKLARLRQARDQMVNLC